MNLFTPTIFPFSHMAVSNIVNHKSEETSLTCWATQKILCHCLLQHPKLLFPRHRGSSEQWAHTTMSASQRKWNGGWDPLVGGKGVENYIYIYTFASIIPRSMRRCCGVSFETEHSNRLRSGIEFISDRSIRRRDIGGKSLSKSKVSASMRWSFWQRNSWRLNLMDRLLWKWSTPVKTTPKNRLQSETKEPSTFH